MGILAMTWDATWEAYGSGSGRVRTDQHSLWSPEREYWSKPSRTQHSCKVLGVSALHYSTRSQEGFQTLASACVLCLTTHYSCLSISGAYQRFVTSCNTL